MLRSLLVLLLVSVWIGGCANAPATVERDIAIVTAPDLSTPASASQVEAMPIPTEAPASRAALPPIDRLPDDFAHGGAVRAATDIDLIVIHTIGGPTCPNGEVVFSPAAGSAVSWRDWFLGQASKSIHYVVGREGDIAQQRPDLRTAGHVSFGGVMQRVNQRSIGIELVNRGDGIEPFPQAQLGALKALVSDLSSRYGLSPQALVTHAALDTRLQGECGGKPLRRNLDPGPLFPLEDVRAAIRAK